MESPSRLLSLPGELRNKVFELVLSEAQGLEYVRDADETGKLCLYTSRVDRRHVVHGQTGPISASLASSAPIPHGDRIIANQLQYVCRQLRFETKSLDVLYNTITFTSPQAAKFMLFADNPQLQLQNHSHDFVLRVPETEKWTTNMLKETSAFFRAYPRCTLKIYHPKLVSTKPSSILFTALLIKYGARNDNTFLSKLTGDTQLQDRILSVLPLQVENDFVTLIPENIVFYPYDKFDEAAFRDSCTNHAVIRLILKTKADGGLDELMAIAKDLYSSGF